MDLDLEIWDENLEYLGSAFTMGPSKDIFDGGLGNEWISVGDHGLKDGKYIMAVYNNEWDIDKNRKCHP